ncbi:MAG TPA: CTP synthase [Candidatus Nitrosotenuis sp.]|jgi:CTP synthase|nr:CTP synthase [Candidatus Nitrosotenuis sp.]
MSNPSTRYIFVTGGVVSSLGKGIVAASLGALMKARGLKVTIQKLDPYINVDAGTMNPYQHGEVFVTDDGAETDLDLGHYERFVDESLGRDNNVTTGKVYGAVIERERRGDYLGDTVRVIPHVTDQIKESIRKVARESGADVVLCEVGGTVGDIEGLPFLEAIRQVKKDVGPGRALYVHVTLVPHLGAAGELKTKPTQHSVKELRAIGIQPDIIVCRTEKELTPEMVDKIALYTDVSPKAVFESRDVSSIYEVPLRLEEQGVGDLVVERLGLPAQAPDLTEWNSLVQRIKMPSGQVRIALVGKYVELKDAYISLAEALTHGGIANNAAVEIVRLDAESVARGEQDEVLHSAHGVLVPGGFGSRGIEGKIQAIQFARTEKVPYLGICYGMQWAVVEFARHVCGWKGAHSTEVEPDCAYPVIAEMSEQKDLRQMGGTMRLGSYQCRLRKGTRAYAAYGVLEVSERHRHRYELNNRFRMDLEEAGLVISGVNPERNLVEIVEIKEHPWFVACQFHPEFKSRPYRAHPLFREFIRAALLYSRGARNEEEVASPAPV